MTKVLLYNIEKGKAMKIKMLCHKLNIASQTVEKDEFGLKLSALLGADDDKTVKPDSDFNEEMLYLSDFFGPMLSIFLNQLKRQKTPVAAEYLSKPAQAAKNTRRVKGGADRNKYKLHLL